MAIMALSLYIIADGEAEQLNQSATHASQNKKDRKNEQLRLFIVICCAVLAIYIALLVRCRGKGWLLMLIGAFMIVSAFYFANIKPFWFCPALIITGVLLLILSSAFAREQSIDTKQ